MTVNRRMTRHLQKYTRMVTIIVRTDAELITIQRVSRTNYETTGAEESVHWIQSPCQNFLKIWCHLPDNEIEEPVGGGRQRYTLRANRKWHDLSPLSKRDKMSNGKYNRPRVDTATELGPN